MLRPGDASVAAPFTSRTPSVRAVVDLIRQGWCSKHFKAIYKSVFFTFFKLRANFISPTSFLDLTLSLFFSRFVFSSLTSHFSLLHLSLSLSFILSLSLSLSFTLSLSLSLSISLYIYIYLSISLFSYPFVCLHRLISSYCICRSLYASLSINAAADHDARIHHCCLYSLRPVSAQCSII